MRPYGRSTLPIPPLKSGTATGAVDERASARARRLHLVVYKRRAHATGEVPQKEKVGSASNPPPGLNHQ